MICTFDVKTHTHTYYLLTQVAKWHVEKYYSVVGIVEEMDLSLKVMEKYLPKFFLNATAIYRKEIVSDLNGDLIQKLSGTNLISNKNPLSKKVKEETRLNLMHHPVFKLEYEFYEFVRQRLHIQAATIS